MEDVERRVIVRLEEDTSTLKKDLSKSAEIL